MNASARSMEHPQRWPLVAQPSNRSESFLTDARLVNCFAEKDPNTGEYWIQKRVGYTLDYTTPKTSGNGMYAFGQIGLPKDSYAVFSSGLTTLRATMYKNGSLFGADNGLQGQSAGFNFFFVEDQAAPYQHLIFSDGYAIYSTTGISPWAQVNVPPGGAFVRGLAYLDQTIYYMDSLNNIYGSGFNDPTTWTGTNVVIANSIPGTPIQLTQQLNYVIALKSNSMEVFYDAANPPPGSPLSPVAGALSYYGCLAGSVQMIDDVLLYATSNKTVSPQIVRVDNLQSKIISIPSIERVLDPYQASNLPLASWSFKHGGHRFYGLTFAPITVGSVGYTLVYDIDQQLWYQWTDQNGNYWPVAAMSHDYNYHHVLQGFSDGSVYLFEGDYEYSTDNGVVAPVEIYTPNADFGTRRRKVLHQMYLNADQQEGSILYISRSDDDYKSWSIPRRVDLGKKTPRMRNEGTFVRRAYHMKHISPTPLRLRSAELQMDIGVI